MGNIISIGYLEVLKVCLRDVVGGFAAGANAW